ncbi:MAG: hypothetical protein K0Q87_1680 [Neobacillus sp.]|nr:hypothetical protein [Neobacillus sp.]
MLNPVTREETEKCLRFILNEKGFDLSPERANGETGVNILARKGEDEYHIEVIGYKSSGPARAKDFFESFFRAISRVKDGAVHCVMAIPDQARVGLPMRANQYGVAWRRLGDAFPELEIWLVNIEEASYEQSKWNEWLNFEG